MPKDIPLSKKDLWPINCQDNDQDLTQAQECGLNGDVESEMHDMYDTINRLRNRNVAQLLDDLGPQPPCVIRSIKRQFTRFANDTIQEIQDHGNNEDHEQRFNR